MNIGSKFSSDEIEDIEDAAVAAGVATFTSRDKSQVIVSGLPPLNVDYQLKKVGKSYVLISTDGQEVGRVEHAVDIISLLELALKKAPSK